MCGESSTAKAMTTHLQQQGVMAGAIVFPMVARDKARIRTQMSSGLSKDDLNEVLRILEEIGPKVGLIWLRCKILCNRDFMHYSASNASTTSSNSVSSPAKSSADSCCDLLNVFVLPNGLMPSSIMQSRRHLGAQERWTYAGPGSSRTNRDIPLGMSRKLE